MTQIMAQSDLDGAIALFYELLDPYGTPESINVDAALDATYAALGVKPEILLVEILSRVNLPQELFSQVALRCAALYSAKPELWEVFLSHENSWVREMCVRNANVPVERAEELAGDASDLVRWYVRQRLHRTIV